MRTLFLIFSIFFSIQISLSQKTVTGTVSDETGEHLPGVSVFVKGTKIGTITDTDGKFSIKMPEDSTKHILVFNFIGMENYELDVSDKTSVEVKMSPSEEPTMDEVVTAIGVEREEISIGYCDDIRNSERKTDKIKPKSRAAGFTDLRRYRRKGSSKSTKIRDRKPREGSMFGSDASDTESEGSGSSTSENAKTGLLTAGEVNDFKKWELWKDIGKTELSRFVSTWTMFPQKRYCVQVSNNNKQGVPDAEVLMLSSFGDTLWAAKTDNTGKAELWPQIFKYKDSLQADMKIHVNYEGKTSFIQNPKEFHQGVNFLDLDIDCSYREAVDIAFVVDATGSMGDEINYLKAEMKDILEKIENQYSDIRLRTASVFYRDRADDYLVKSSPFTDKVKATSKFISRQSAGGGGDFPEAVDAGLDEAINKLDWNKNARTRILFLVLDAPPHNSNSYTLKMQELTRKAARKGIRIIPITGSGTDKSTEYLMRSLALATNGTYVFLTDDSGVGGSHIKPTTDKFDVESMNKLLRRILDQYLYLPKCIVSEEEQDPDNEINADKENAYKHEDAFGPEVSEAKLKVYPNPTSGPVTIKGYTEDTDLFLTDMSGKIVKRISTSGNRKIQSNFGEFPSGIYFIAYGEGKNRKAEKIIIRH